MNQQIDENLNIPEILAPAGGPAQFFAALNSGADAVFLGLKVFNARARAANFTTEELRALMPLARRYEMKVLVTLNILIKEVELPLLVDTLSELEDIGVDAIIVQDLGVARLARRHFPALRLHASTQMAVHNLAGVLQAAEWGFKRVVVAREMTATELRRIRAAVPRDVIEIEAFSHGSLCYSYSGLCFFSGAADARSGNRGECSYTCRQPYKVLNEEGHGFLFSMRDLDTAEDLDKMLSSGIDTLKIEGRKKDAQYVSSVVKLYRSRLDKIVGRSTLRDSAPAEARAIYQSNNVTSDQISSAARADMELSFQRRATSFFLNGRYHENVIDLDNPGHIGVRVGEILRADRGWIKVRTEVPLERYDGLRVSKAARVHHSLPQHGTKTIENTEVTRGMQDRYEGRDLEFSLREMTIFSESSPTAKAGSTVTITLPLDRPRDAPPVVVGDILYKTRSADLKRRVEAVSSAPAGDRIRALTPVDVKVEVLAHDSVVVKVSVWRFGSLLAEAQATLDASEARKPRFAEDCRETFAVFGDEGFAAENIEVSETNWFVPNKILKQLKREIGVDLVRAHSQLIAARKANAVGDLEAGVQKLEPAKGSPRFSVKLDRLEYLGFLARYLAENSDFSLSEIVYEPKRAFLKSSKPEEITEALSAFIAQTKIPVRFALPTVIRNWDEPILGLHLKACVEAGIVGFEIGNPGALHQVREWESQGTIDSVTAQNITTDFTAYSLNHLAASQWASEGVRLVALSIEDDKENMVNQLNHWPAGDSRPQAILYKDTPLFVAEACSLTALHGGCPGATVCGYRTLHIENQKGERFYAAHEGCKSIVYGENAYGVTQNIKVLQEAGVNDFRIDFLTRPYSETRFAEVLKASFCGEQVSETHKANFETRLL